MRLDFITSILPQAVISGNSFTHDAHIQFDSREIKSGDLFVCLSGAKRDGHSFIEQAIAHGAAAIIAQQDKKDSIPNLLLHVKRVTFIFVRDTLDAFLSLAKAWRSQFTCPIVGITGSVGKTSTKHMVKNVLNQAGKNFFISHGNQNTLLGVSLNLLRMRPEHEGAIFEVGINRRGEMARIVQLLQPTLALITNVGHAHMEGLGSLENIALEKRDIFSCFTEKNIGIINGDQPLLSHVAYHHPVVRFGTKLTNQIQARKVSVKDGRISFLLTIYRHKYPITFNHAHIGIVQQVLAAAAIAYLIGIPDATIIKGIQIPSAVEGRFERRPLPRYRATIINDCYNANPESVKAALLAFDQMQARGNKIAVLGDMLELGHNGPFWHRQIGRFLRKITTLDRLILVGSMVDWVKKAAPASIAITQVPTWQDAVAMLEPELNKDALVLVKGSNAIGLTNLVKTFSEVQ